MHLFIADDSDVLIERLIEILSDTEGVEIVGQEGYANKVVEALLEKIIDLIKRSVQSHKQT
jgi:DNA-binding NarL/FixJ family response regulator